MPMPGQSIFSGGGFAGQPQYTTSNGGLPVHHPAHRPLKPGSLGPVREAAPQSYEDAMNMFSQKSAAQDAANERRRRKVHGHLDSIRQADEADPDEYYDDEDEVPDLG
jgi:hypothetical protein